MADTPDFPALVELASRLEGKDKKTCELALYTLKKLDTRLAIRDRRIVRLESILSQIESIASDEDAPTSFIRVCRIRAALESKDG